MLSLDYETACDIDLRRVGLDAYTAHPSFRVLMAAYRIDKGPLEHWQPHEGPIPADLRDALLDPVLKKWAFNAQFERVATRRGLQIDTRIKGWRCAMVLAYMQSFMGGLGDVGEQIGLPLDMQKKKDGMRLIRKFSMPQRVSKNQPHLWRNWITDPEDWEYFCEYNKQDVVTEEAVRERLAPFPVLEDEWDFYELDQRINDRGMPIDRRFVENVLWMSERRKNELLDDMRQLTGLDNPNSTAQLLPWLQANGYPYDDLREHTVSKVLGQASTLWGCSPSVQDADAPVALVVLRRRQWAARTSTKKASAALRSVGEGDCVRYMFQFGGASRTQRFAGRLVQPQNLPRTPKVLDPEEDSERLDVAGDLIRQGNYDACELFIEEPMQMFTGTMRSMFRVPDGDKFEVCDYSSIETVALAWMTGCERLLSVFREGRDAYKDFGTYWFKKPYEAVTRGERQLCKPAVLGCGYRLGPGKVFEDGRKTGLLAYAENMGVAMTPEETLEAVQTYRVTYAEVKQFWYDCETAVKHVLTTHQPYQLGYFRFEWLKPYLLIKLPSGRYIYYYKPRLETREVDSGRTKWVHGEEVPDTYLRTAFTYMGRDQKTTKWKRIEAHGGVTTENIDQAFCRDILKVGMQRLHARGFDIVGHAHDEAITVSPIGDNYRTKARMREIMCKPISWAPGFPLNATGWSGQYYRKA